MKVGVRGDGFYMGDPMLARVVKNKNLKLFANYIFTAVSNCSNM